MNTSKTAATYMGKSCKRGHSGERLVSNGNCVVCNQVRARKWKNDNPEKQREYERRHDALRTVVSRGYPDAIVPLTAEEEQVMRDMYDLARHLTKTTAVRHEVAHDVALSKGGKHHPRNIAVTTAAANRLQRDRTFAESKAQGLFIQRYYTDSYRRWQAGQQKQAA